MTLPLLLQPAPSGAWRVGDPLALLEREWGQTAGFYLPGDADLAGGRLRDDGLHPRLVAVVLQAGNVEIG